METAALIVAAGMSSRMGSFKPMLNIGSISVAQRVIANFRQAGINKIVMITGFNATMLERHLAGNNIIFLRNENYESTQMFDSVKIGLNYLSDKCERLLFTPVDVPLFTSQTVKKLLSSGAKLACPVCNGLTGHPLLISKELFPTILADSGDGGLKGAVDRCGAELVQISVDDPGTVRDADTPEDFSALLELHNSQLIRPVINISLSKEKVFFDSRIATLLTLIDETSSVRAAGQRMQLSYSSCWNIIRRLEEQLNYSLVERNQGGSGGSRSALTEKGKLLIERYNSYTKLLSSYAEELYEEQFKGLFD